MKLLRTVFFMASFLFVSYCFASEMIYKTPKGLSNPGIEYKLKFDKSWVRIENQDGQNVNNEGNFVYKSYFIEVPKDNKLSNKSSIILTNENELKEISKNMEKQAFVLTFERNGESMPNDEINFFKLSTALVWKDRCGEDIKVNFSSGALNYKIFTILCEKKELNYNLSGVSLVVTDKKKYTVFNFVMKEDKKIKFDKEYENKISLDFVNVLKNSEFCIEGTCDSMEKLFTNL